MPTQNNPNGEKSYSNKTALVFLEAYLAANPLETIEDLRSWETTYLPDNKAANAIVTTDTSIQGLSQSQEEVQAWTKVVQAINQLRPARKYLIS